MKTVDDAPPLPAGYVWPPCSAALVDPQPHQWTFDEDLCTICGLTRADADAGTLVQVYYVNAGADRRPSEMRRHP